MKIVVTQHAIQRMKERFYFTFPSSFWLNKHTIEGLIVGQVSTAIECIKWKQSDFYYNMISWKYGQNFKLFFKSGVYYCCKQHNDVLSVHTVVKKFVGECN